MIDKNTLTEVAGRATMICRYEAKEEEMTDHGLPEVPFRGV